MLIQSWWSMVRALWKMRWYIFKFLNASTNKSILVMLRMLQCHGTYCFAKSSRPVYVTKPLRLHFANESKKSWLDKSRNNMVWWINCGISESCMPFIPHPWWQLLGCSITKLLFFSHFLCMILSPLNQRLQNAFWQIPAWPHFTFHPLGEAEHKLVTSSKRVNNKEKSVAFSNYSLF